MHTGSACFSRSLDPRTLGIGGNPERAHGSVRLTLADLIPWKFDAVADALTQVVENLRKIRPLGMK